MQNNRALEIMAILSDKENVTAGKLARRFDVSTRTIYRDIDMLIQAGIPISASRGKNGGILLADDYIVDPAALDSVSHMNIAAVMQKLSNPNESEVSGIPVIPSVSTDWVEVNLSDVQDNGEEQKKFDRIKSAVINSSAIEFDYFNSLGQTSLRTANPLKLIFKGATWFLYAYCGDKQDFRSFKVSRIRNLRILSHFEPSQIPENPPDAESSPQNMECVSLLLKINPTMAYRVFDEFQTFIKDSDKSFLVQTQMPPGEWLYSYLMSYGEYLEVLKPDWLKAELKKRFESAAKKYKSLT